MSKRGLPTGLQMRHDAHYVEELSQHRPQQVGRMIPVDKIDPNPEQPRTEIGDLTELTASIAEKGASATSGAISMPRFIGPGCITRTSGLHARSRSFVMP